MSGNVTKATAEERAQTIRNAEAMLSGLDTVNLEQVANAIIFVLASIATRAYPTSRADRERLVDDIASSVKTTMRYSEGPRN